MNYDPSVTNVMQNINDLKTLESSNRLRIYLCFLLLDDCFKSFIHISTPPSRLRALINRRLLTDNPVSNFIKTLFAEYSARIIKIF